MSFRNQGSGSFAAAFNPDEAVAANRMARPNGSSVGRGADGGAAIIDLAKEVLRQTADTHRESVCVSDQYVAAFSRVLLDGRYREALNLARAFALRGGRYGEIAEGLFAAAARRLGDAWRTDSGSLIDVNRGLSTLLRTNKALSANWPAPARPFEGSALFASIQGQSHTLGLLFAKEYFRRNGWTIRYVPDASSDELLAMAEALRPDIVGMTAATDADLRLIGGVIVQLQQSPAGPRVVVGGGAPRLKTLGADAVVSRLDMGLVTAHRLIK